jgi:hypothetical protein
MMAFRDSGIPDDDGKVLQSGFFNVSMPVGKGGSNQRGDVMLVQLLLKKFYDQHKDVPAPGGKMVVDGVPGPITQRWINTFQMQQRTKFPDGVAVDGVVDRARKPWISTISRTLYTILVLNFYLEQSDPKGFAQLPFDKECPSFLAGELLFYGPN